MAENKIWTLIILGSGPAGLTAGIYGARANLSPLIIDGPKPGGQLMTTTYVENWPGNKSILGADLMMNMKEHALSFKCSFLSESIVKVNFLQKPFTLWTNKNNELKTYSVIIATGATPKTLNCPGEKEFWGKGVSTCAVCDGAFFKDQPVVIIGGGDTAMEDARFMTKFTNDITVIHLLEKLTASYAMQQNVINNPKIKIIYNSTVTEIKGTDKVSEVIITNQLTKEKQGLKTNAVFLAIGLTPNAGIFKNQIELTPYGYIASKEYTKTSVEGVFVAGDVTDAKYRQAITSAGHGCSAALDAERYLTSAKVL